MSVFGRINQSRPAGAVFLDDGIGYKYLAPLGLHSSFFILHSRPKGAETFCDYTQENMNFFLKKANKIWNRRI